MQPIGKILQMSQPKISSGTQANRNAKSPQKATSSLSPDANSQRIEDLFTRFAAFYGHVWRSQFKSEGFLAFSKKEWQNALTEFSDTILKQAILDCRNFYELPPTLPQVIDCCRKLKKREAFFVVGQEKLTPAKPEVARAHLAQCKAFLTTSVTRRQ